MRQEKEIRDERREKFCDESMAYLDHLYRVALHIAKESTEAEDLVQETFARALASYQQFTAGTNMKAWLTTILYNLFFHHHKQKKRWIAVEDDFTENDGRSDYWERVPTETPGPESHILLKELQGKIADVLRKIPEEFRLPIILVVMGDFSYEEAAKILSCPVGTIRSRLSRARKMIYKQLKGYLAMKENEREKK
jgi:RNA polymerase sigma-70 factor, ECF subfamily